MQLAVIHLRSRPERPIRVVADFILLRGSARRPLPSRAGRGVGSTSRTPGARGRFFHVPERPRAAPPTAPYFSAWRPAPGAFHNMLVLLDCNQPATSKKMCSARTHDATALRVPTRLFQPRLIFSAWRLAPGALHNMLVLLDCNQPATAQAVRDSPLLSFDCVSCDTLCYAQTICHQYLSATPTYSTTPTPRRRRGTPTLLTNGPLAPTS